MTQTNICILFNTLCEDGFTADERNFNSGSKTSVGNIIYSVLRQDDKVFKPVLGDE